MREINDCISDSPDSDGRFETCSFRYVPWNDHPGPPGLADLGFEKMALVVGPEGTVQSQRLQMLYLRNLVALRWIPCRYRLLVLQMSEWRVLIQGNSLLNNTLAGSTDN